MLDLVLCMFSAVAFRPPPSDLLPAVCPATATATAMAESPMGVFSALQPGVPPANMRLWNAVSVMHLHCCIFSFSVSLGYGAIV